LFLTRIIAALLAMLARRLVGAVEAGQLVGIVTARFAVALFVFA
jgi:hypothetical protein